MRLISFVLVLLVLPVKVFSQDVQAWLDGYFYLRIGNAIENETNLGYNKLLGDQGWNSTYLSNTLSFQPFGWYVAEGAAEYNITRDPSGPDVNEVKFFVAQKFNFTGYIDKINLQSPYIYIRLEQRILNYIGLDTTEYKTRLRLRLGGRFLLNNDNLSDGTFYLPFYFETFHNFNGEAFERYASRSRMVIGVGYLFNARWRAEFTHYAQRSGHKTEGGVEKTDVMFQLLFRYYLIRNAGK